MSGIAERLAELSRRVTGIDLRLVSIDEERAANSVEAAQGGKTALQKIAALDSEHDQLLRSKSTFISAADQLDAQLKEEEAAAAAGRQAERQARARECGAAVCTINLELDDLLQQVREAFERREKMVNSLRQNSGITTLEHAIEAIMARAVGERAREVMMQPRRSA